MMTPDKAVGPPNPLLGVTVTTFLLDSRGDLVGWSRAAEELLGYRAEEVLGRPVDTLLEDPGDREALLSDVFADRDRSTTGRVHCLHHRSGRAVPVVLVIHSLLQPSTEAARLVVALDVNQLRRLATRQAMLTGLASQSPVTLVLYDVNGTLVWVNPLLESQLGLRSESMIGLRPVEILPDGAVISGAPPHMTLEQVLEQVLLDGEPVIDLHYRATTPADPQHPRVWSCSFFRLEDETGVRLGACCAGFDVTEHYLAQERLALLSRATIRIGRRLDVRQTAADLAEVAVPAFASAAAVDVVAQVLEGGEPSVVGSRAAPPDLERMALRTAPYCQSAPDLPADLGVPQSTVQHCLSTGSPTMLQDTEIGDTTSVLVVPVRIRRAVLGVATFLRAVPLEPFDANDLALAEELVARTAVCLDNARRFAREHATALALQRHLLPRQFPESPAIQIAHHYLPATSPTAVGGDWYDVIPLSGGRVGLVVGDVPGQGITAAATMGRLRTTVNALARLDLSPEEVLAHLDDFVAQPILDELLPDGTGLDNTALGATCLYAVYDPVMRRCVMARAGHPAPAVVTPAGDVTFLDLPAGPPLGLGGLPFECAEFDLPDGSVLALFTNGLIDTRDRDVDAALDRLSQILSHPHRSQQDLEQSGQEAVTALVSKPTKDDAALLLVRVQGLDSRHVATWALDTDHTEVGRARALAVDQLTAWGMENTAFTVELVVSELVTNAMRYGGAPVHLRLVRDRALICEVSDAGHTSPHLRRATIEDEGGRGLFLVAQMTSAWGTRYTPNGKVIWAEVPN